MYCLLSPRLCNYYCNYADELLKLFVSHSGNIYGEGFYVYNVHSLIHIADDVRKFGALDSISAFPFENFLHQIKRMIRKPQQPLQQVLRRLAEKKKVVSKKDPERFSKKCHQNEHANGPNPLPGATEYKSVTTAGFTLDSSDRNNCILLDNGKVALVKNVLVLKSETFFACNSFKKKENYFTYPLNSSEISIFKVSELGESIDIFQWDKMVCKCCCFPINENKFVIIPLCHNN